MPGSRVQVPPFPPDQPLVRSFFAARRQVNQQMHRLETLAPARLRNAAAREAKLEHRRAMWRAAARRQRDGWRFRDEWRRDGHTSIRLVPTVMFHNREVRRRLTPASGCVKCAALWTSSENPWSIRAPWQAPVARRGCIRLRSGNPEPIRPRSDSWYCLRRNAGGGRDWGDRPSTPQAPFQVRRTLRSVAWRRGAVKRDTKPSIWAGLV